jgi:hypothetical protein
MLFVVDQRFRGICHGHVENATLIVKCVSFIVVLSAAGCGTCILSVR